MIEQSTSYSLFEFSTRIWINDLLFSHPIVLKQLGLPSSIYLTILIFGVTFFTALWIIPQMIRFAYRFALVDRPNSRKHHIKSTPVLGGLSIFFSVFFAFTFVGLFLKNAPILNLDFKIIFGLFGAVSLMVFFGLKDDIFGASPFEKIVFQILAALLIIICCEIRIQTFDGLFGINELPTFFSYVFSVFVFVIVVNAFNLIDGIDGLSASIGLVSTLSFGVFFFLGDLVIHSLIMFCYSGALLSFLLFNFKKKMFLGDNGSMSLGVIVAFGVFSLITASHDAKLLAETNYFIENASIVALALISFPLLDTLRIFCVRLMKGKSPFIADRNHLHHHLIELNFSHFNSTLSIVSYTIIVTGIALALRSWDITIHFFGMLFLSSLIYLITWLPKRHLTTKNNMKT